MAGIWNDPDVGAFRLGSGAFYNDAGVDVSDLFDPSSRISAGGSTLTLTSASDSKTIMLDTLAGTVVTLPAASGSGVRFKFVVSAAATSNSHIVKVANASDTFKGVILTLSDNSAAVLGYAAGASDDTITLNRGTTGSTIVGEWIEVEDIKANVWAVRGITASTGTEATPFSATVS